jgi:hypothetical protein
MSHGYRVTGAVAPMPAVDRRRGVPHEIDREPYGSVILWKIFARDASLASVPLNPYNPVEER